MKSITVKKMVESLKLDSRGDDAMKMIIDGSVELWKYNKGGEPPPKIFTALVYSYLICLRDIIEGKVTEETLKKHVGKEVSSRKS